MWNWGVRTKSSTLPWGETCSGTLAWTPVWHVVPTVAGDRRLAKDVEVLGNYVGLQEDPLTMYSKLEKTPDNVIKDYFELLTRLPLTELPENPRDRQKLLALEVTRQFHGEVAAQQAQTDAMNLVQGGGVAESVPEFSLSAVNFPAKAFYLLGSTPLCASSSEARRQIQGGAVKLEGDRLADPNLTFAEPDELYGKVLQVGKKKFVRLVQ
jgi:tyrosyl-tRNA synthetase